MWDIMRRWFSETRPIDWVIVIIELLVLAVIAAEAGHHVCRHLKLKRIARRLREFTTAGFALSQVVPNGDADAPAWIERVQQWSRETYRYLEENSLQAHLTFLQDPHQLRLVTHGVCAAAQAWYGTLMVRLINLRSIAEKPEVYF